MSEETPPDGVEGETVMADNDTDARAYGRSSEQNPNLGSVDRLVGTSVRSETCKERWPSGAWRAASSSSGASTSGRGADRGSGVSRLSSTNGRSGPSEEIGSRFYGNTNDTMDYG